MRARAVAFCPLSPDGSLYAHIVAALALAVRCSDATKTGDFQTFPIRDIVSYKCQQLALSPFARTHRCFRLKKKKVPYWLLV